MRFDETPVTLDGLTHTVAEWAEMRRLKMKTIKSRRQRGMTWAQALSCDDKRDRNFFFGRKGKK